MHTLRGSMMNKIKELERRYVKLLKDQRKLITAGDCDNLPVIIAMSDELCDIMTEIAAAKTGVES
jgi:hypothetical protein